MEIKSFVWIWGFQKSHTYKPVLKILFKLPDKKCKSLAINLNIIFSLFTAWVFFSQLIVYKTSSDKNLSYMGEINHYFPQNSLMIFQIAFQVYAS